MRDVNLDICLNEFPTQASIQEIHKYGDEVVRNNEPHRDLTKELNDTKIPTKRLRDGCVSNDTIPVKVLSKTVGLCLIHERKSNLNTVELNGNIIQKYNGRNENESIENEKEAQSCINILRNDDFKFEDRIESVGDLPTDINLRIHPALRQSLFPNVPPFIRFTAHPKGKMFPNVIKKQLRWKVTTITPLVVRKVVTQSGYRLLRKNTEWAGTWGKHAKSVSFRTLHNYQKMNHFPGSFNLGRKDRIWRNLQRAASKFGKEEFNFMPETFILPYDMKWLRIAWEKDIGHERWIIKPPASARGTGIKVIHKWSQIPRKSCMIVQKYVSNPYLINGTKFDLRLYVLITSINPLRIYLYDNGLVRFASAKYSCDANMLGDRYMHLTNYSINRQSSDYTENDDVHACQGHKWTLKSLWNYMEKELNVNVDELWNTLVDLIIKTILTSEWSMNQLTNENLNSIYNAYELFGVDVLFDEELKPWLLEINISPSLHSASTLDQAVKEPLVRNLLNLVGYHIPPSKKTTEEQMKKFMGGFDGPLCYDERLYYPFTSPSEKRKHATFVNSQREDYLDKILEDLTPGDVRHLIHCEEELSQVGSFQRIFPTENTHEYFQYLEAPRYYNLLLDAWETKYNTCRSRGMELLRSKCKENVHLDISELKCYDWCKTYKIHQSHQLKRKNVIRKGNHEGKRIRYICGVNNTSKVVRSMQRLRINRVFNKMNTYQKPSK